MIMLFAFAVMMFVCVPIGLIVEMINDPSDRPRSCELEGYQEDAYDTFLDVSYIAGIVAGEFAIPVLTAPFRLVWWLATGGFMDKRPIEDR